MEIIVKRSNKYLFFFSFSLILVLLFWKCKFGFANQDESFYLTIPYRLCQGDSLFFDEWNLSQMSAFLLFPLLKLYFLFFDSTEAILLNFRYIYTALHALTSLFIFFRLKKTDFFSASIASICFLIYAPFGIMALSYNSLAIINLSLSLVIFATISKRNAVCQLFFSGFFFASSVLCCPHISAIYFLYSCACFISLLLKRNTDSRLSFKTWAIFSSGIIFQSILFFSFVFHRISLHEFLISLPEILFDPDHLHLSFISYVNSYARSILLSSSIALPCFILLFILFVIEIIDKQRVKHRLFYFFSVLSIIILYYLSIICEKLYINFLMFPINILSFFCLFLTSNRLIKELFWFGFFPGVCYSFLANMASNQTFYAISSAFSVSLLFSFLIITFSLKEFFPEKSKITSFLLIALSLLQISSELYTRVNFVFWEPSLATQTEEITAGAEKGIWANEERASLYLNSLENLEKLENNNQLSSIAFFSGEPWLYLDTPYRNASYSAWLDFENTYSLEKLKKYYSFNPAKWPDAVYVSSKYEPYFIFFSENDYYHENVDSDFIIMFKQKG